MNSTAICVENLSKSYRLGVIGTGTFYGDLNRWWARRRGKPDPYLKIGELDYRHRVGENIWALRDLNFTIDEGKAVGIIGRNGAGKSTLLKILSRVTAPTSGQVYIKGRIASLLEVGTGFHAELTGRENIFLNGAILGMNRAEVSRKFDEIVDFSGVEKFIDTPVKRYSSGMYVRLAFAVAAHLEPDILVIDEVLAVGDSEFQRKCLNKMSDVTRHGRTVLFVSHNMAAIRHLCTDTIYLENGSIVSMAETEEVVSSYLSNIEPEFAVTSLRDRLDRQGSGRAKIVDFYVTDSSGHKQMKLESGRNYSFVMEYERIDPGDPIMDAVGSIGITDADNQLILLFRSNFSNQNFVLSGPRGRIECMVKDLNLAPGTYNIIVFISNGESETLDLVNDAAQIHVEGGDYFGTGSVGLPSLCKVLSRSEWKTL
jgi:lipopolysaccharide transport system ATP-binding protein